MLLEAGAIASVSWACRTPLMSAVANKDIDTVKLLIAAGAKIDVVSKSHPSALQTAIEGDDLEMVDILLGAGANPNIGANFGNARTRKTNFACHALHHESFAAVTLPLTAAASRCGGTEIVQRLIWAGADVDGFLAPSSKLCWQHDASENPRFNEYTRTALEASIDRSDYQMTEVLLAAGASINARDAAKETPLQQACTLLRHRLGQEGIIELLLQRGADVNALPPSSYHGQTALQAAAESGHYDIVTLLISHGGDIHAQPINKGAKTCLQAAASSGNTKLVRLLLSLGADINCRGLSDGLTALEAAIENSHVAVVRQLLDAGLDINQRGRCGSPLSTAIIKRSLELFDECIARGADLDPPKCAMTPLVAAIRWNWTHAVRFLIQAGVDVNRTKYVDVDENGDERYWNISTPLIEALIADDIEPEIVKMLLEAGAKVTGKASQCLELGVQSESADIVKLLLQHGADPNQPVLGEERLTPLHLAFNDDDELSVQLDILKILIESGADVNAYSPKKGYPLQLACRLVLEYRDFCWDESLEENEFTKARDMLLHAGADPTLYSEPSPERDLGSFDVMWDKMQSAAQRGDLESIRSLIASGEDVNTPAVEDRGATALQWAAISGHLDMAILLLENGANINAPGARIDGRTALQGAAEHGRLDMVHLLLENDDEPQLLGLHCHEAASYAEARGHIVIAQILRQWIKG